jgi:hypothetical protein
VATLNERNRFDLESGPADKLDLNPATRLLTGKLKPASLAKPLDFKGVLLQRQKLGRGLLVPPPPATATGSVELPPAP